jgi:transcription-repair coupling factor (superfamily II helicase)
MLQVFGLNHFIKELSKDKHGPFEIDSFKSISGLAFSIKQIIEAEASKKHLILLPSDNDISKLSSALSFIGFEKYITWPKNELSPYSSIFASYRSLGKRSGILSSIAKEQHSVYIVNISNVSEKLSPISFFEKQSTSFKIGDEFSGSIRSYLTDLGYREVDTVEDPLSFSLKGEILDLYLPNYEKPVRIELFDTEIESMRFFDPNNQRSSEKVSELVIGPASESLYEYTDLEALLERWKASCEETGISWEAKKEFVKQITRRQYFEGLHYLFPYFHSETTQLLELFKQDRVWLFDAHECLRQWELYYADKKEGFKSSLENDLSPNYKDLYIPPESFDSSATNLVYLNPVKIEDEFPVSAAKSYKAHFQLSKNQFLNVENSAKAPQEKLQERLKAWKHQDYKVLASFSNATQLERAKLIITSCGLKYHQLKSLEEIESSFSRQESQTDLISIVVADVEEGLIFEEDRLAILNGEDFFGKKTEIKKRKNTGSLESRTNQLKFSDLKKGDPIVHIQHGVGKYIGTTTMDNAGASTEFIQLEYKGGDKLYVPVYKIASLQKYSGTHSVDRLGGSSWEKAKVKVKSALKEIADELIRLYAKRAQITRPAYSPPDQNYYKFEDEFPYTETDDQVGALGDILQDLTSTKPMDRLVCGDVGFGKTEVAMRAAFKALEENKQVALLVPTTVLAFQHYENFKKRFKSWPFEIRSLGRFTPKKEQKETLELMAMGKVDLVIGTHRLLSSDIKFAKLGMLITDEEHRFGVSHKEKLKQLKANLDCLALSATPIPRTLNMALMGVRDLSVINTPPQDRLPIRTFINRFNKTSIRKAILAELQRNGQVYFIHNRVQSIYARAQELREIVPEARIEVAHGQMKDGELEKVMLRFFEHKFDILLCTTIVENGVDNAKANTMIIDNAQNFGLSQLYQLRGRVGRSKERAYCYLVIPQNLKLDPDAKERLKVIQENTALGSGFKIAHHDLELRGAGSFLGAEQSGHANTVGYDLYLELLEQSIKEAKGEEISEEIEPEINLKIPALIPDRYIPDIRIRLSFYKSLSEIESESDLENIEDELVDQFGKLPEEVVNLMGIMLIRKYCKDLGIKEVSAGSVNVSFTFSDRTSIAVNKLVDLAIKKPQQYRLTPDNRFLIRFKEISWPNVLEATKFLAKL